MENAAGVRFILKYGLVIIIVLAVIILANKAGVFDSLFAHEGCKVRSGFDCISFSAHKDGVNIILQNLHDYTVFVSSIRFRDCFFSGRYALNPGITHSFQLRDCIIDGKIKDFLTIEFFSSDNVLHQVNGSLVVRVR